MLMALILTFTWLPAAGAAFLKNIPHREPRVISWLRGRYVPAIRRLTTKFGVVTAAIVIALACGVAAGMSRGAEFVPRLEEGALAIQLTRPPSVSLEEAAKGTLEIEKALRKFPDVARVVSRTGSPDVATDVMGIEQSDVIVMLKPREQWVSGHDAASFANAFEPALRRALPGAALGFTQPIEMRVQELIGGVRSDVGVKIYGDDLATLRRLAEQVSGVITLTPGSADVRIDMQLGLRVIDVRPDTRRTGRLGVSTPSILDFTELMQSGQPVGKLREGQRSFDVTLRLGQLPMPDVEPLKKLRIPLSEGRAVMLGDVADIDVLDVPAQVSREQGRRRVTVETNVRGRDLAGFVQDLQARVAQLKLPTGYFIEYGGQFENLSRATKRLLLVVPLTLAAILLLLYLTFGRLRPSLLIFVNVPVAAVGGILALTARGLDLSISAAVGFLALFGVAVLNGVVLIAAIQQHEREGVERSDAVIRACSERFRAILTTALVAALGFVPMAIAQGIGAEVQRPLATVVIGGLITSTLATLLALPTLYVRLAGPRDDDGLGGS